MNVLIFGGTGFVGKNLSKELVDNEYQVFVVTRDRQENLHRLGNEVQLIEWDTFSPLSSIDKLPETDIAINLAGEPIADHRWSSSVKKKIRNSRIRVTSGIVTAINNSTIEPDVLINASAVDYYGARQDDKIDENEEAGESFLAQVCTDWEREAYKVENKFTRVLTMRFGIVLGNEGALNRMVMPFKFYLGGPVGKGEQWFSWIHIKDLTSMIRFIIEHQELSGPINAVAPAPVRMKDFSKTLGNVLNKPSWLPVPEIILKIVLGQMSEMLLQGQRVYPEKISNAGFKFKFPELKSALEDILR